MQEFVLSQDPSPELRDTLRLGRGSGRVKTLLSLANGPRSLGDLAEMTGADAPYVTLIVNELEARGLVTRTPDTEDRRRKLVGLTTTGEHAVQTAQHIINRPPPSLEALPKHELANLADLLDRLATD
jgi:DNA-binding MarR family transcriptional regulator